MATTVQSEGGMFSETNSTKHASTPINLVGLAIIAVILLAGFLGIGIGIGNAIWGGSSSNNSGSSGGGNSINTPNSGFNSFQTRQPIPPKADGYVHQLSGPPNAPIVLEGFIDTLCSDTVRVWPVLTSVVRHYNNYYSNIENPGGIIGNPIYFVYHTFPLPYFTNSYTTNEGLRVIAHLTNYNQTAVTTYTNWILTTQQSIFNNQNTLNLPFTTIKQTLTNQVINSGLFDINIINNNTFLNKLNDPIIDAEMRLGFRYSLSRGATATPFWLINGQYEIDDSSRSWAIGDWVTIIDALLGVNTTSTLPN